LFDLKPTGQTMAETAVPAAFALLVEIKEGPHPLAGGPS